MNEQKLLEQLQELIKSHKTCASMLQEYSTVTTLEVLEEQLEEIMDELNQTKLEVIL